LAGNNRGDIGRKVEIGRVKGKNRKGGRREREVEDRNGRIIRRY